MSALLAQDNLNKFFNDKFLDHNSWFFSKTKVEENRISYEKLADLLSILVNTITGSGSDK
jgi:hypothetical protein